jgi:ribose transport system permease protein
MSSTTLPPAQLQESRPELPRRRGLPASSIQVIAITVVAALSFAVFSVFAAHFFTTSNIFSMAKVSSYNFIVAVGLTFVFIAAEIDLSIGANVAFAGIIMAVCMVDQGLNPWLSALCAVAASSLVGAVNGFIVTMFGVQSFIVTLGMLSVLGGTSLVITDGIPITYQTGLNSPLFSITNGSVGNFPAPAIWAIGAFFLGVFVLRFTKFGYHVYAVGGNVMAAREMGIRVRRTKFLCFVLTGFTCGLVAVLQTGWLGEADPGSGESFTLQTIAAIIVGGVALYGGAGSIYGTLIGTIIMGMLGSGLILLGLNANWPELAQGIIIIFVVSISLGLRRFRPRWASRRPTEVRVSTL